MRGQRRDREELQGRGTKVGGRAVTERAVTERKRQGMEEGRGVEENRAGAAAGDVACLEEAAAQGGPGTGLVTLWQRRPT